MYVYNMLPKVGHRGILVPERVEAARRLFYEGQGLAIFEPYYQVSEFW